MASRTECHKVFFGNIPYDTKEEEIEKWFSQVAPVVHFTLARDNQQALRGYGFCEYADAAAVHEAIRVLGGKPFNGRSLVVRNASEGAGNSADQSSSDTPPQADDYAFTDRLTGKCFSFPFGADGILVPPTELRAQIMRPLELVKAAKSFFALRSPSHHRLQEEPLLPLGFFSTEYSACVPVRFMLGCMASACQRLVAAPADLHGSHKTTWRFAECVMERVTWGRVRIVLQTLENLRVAAASRICLRSHKPRIFVHQAAECSDMSFLHAWLTLNSNSIFERDGFLQWTPLHAAAWTGRLENCRLLLQCYADPQAVTFDYDRCTPLHFSAMYGHLELCRLLVAWKADAAAKSRTGTTALKLAMQRNHVDVVEYLNSISAPQ